jgi:hypothetical protein
MTELFSMRSIVLLYGGIVAVLWTKAFRMCEDERIERIFRTLYDTDGRVRGSEESQTQAFSRRVRSVADAAKRQSSLYADHDASDRAVHGRSK